MLTELRHFLMGDEPHCIARQFRDIYLRHMAIRVMWRTALRAEWRQAPCAWRNPLVSWVVFNDYLDRSSLALRRLTDQARRNDVVSLPRIINGLNTTGVPLTRNAYVTCDGAPYDFDAPKREFEA